MDAMHRESGASSKGLIVLITERPHTLWCGWAAVTRGSLPAWVNDPWRLLDPYPDSSERGYADVARLLSDGERRASTSRRRR
jgi:hypothetical protein